MSKRPIGDVDAGGTLTGPKKSKKSKSADHHDTNHASPSIAAVVVTAVAEKEDREDRKDRKDRKKKKETKDKKKKEKKEKKEKKKGKEEGKAEDGDTTATPEETAGPKLSREERKAARKAAKKERQPVEAGPAAASATATYTQCAELTAMPVEAIGAFLKEHAVFIDDPHRLNLRPITEFSFLPPNPFDFSKFATPSPIQAAAWPFALSGHDCIGVAETGSGKTLAFAVPAVRHVLALARSTGAAAVVRVVVVSPTRELAMQIFEVLERYSEGAGLRAACLYGGVPKAEQRQQLRTAQVIVATPGRLNDLIGEGAADLSGVSYLVLDEADRMLDKGGLALSPERNTRMLTSAGFEEDIRRIISACPGKESRQTLMFTATWPQSVRELAATFMKAAAVKITIGNRGDLRANTRIKQTVEVVDPRCKEQRLLQLIGQHQSGARKDDRILVFCLYRKEAARVEVLLRSKGWRVAGIHGDLNQAQRTRALAQFKSGACPLLVATDVAARGLDIPAVKLVINATFPLTIEDYVHRIGRTGRAGADGIAFTLFTEHDKVGNQTPQSPSFRLLTHSRRSRDP